MLIETENVAKKFLENPVRATMLKPNRIISV